MFNRIVYTIIFIMIIILPFRVDAETYYVNDNLSVMEVAFVINNEYSGVRIVPNMFGRVLVPVRFVSEILGMQVIWNSENQLIRIFDGEGNFVSFTIGEFLVMKGYKSSYQGEDMFVTTEYYELDVYPFILEGTTYIPIRALAEILGADVLFDKYTSIIHIDK